MQDVAIHAADHNGLAQPGFVQGSDIGIGSGVNQKALGFMQETGLVRSDHGSWYLSSEALMSCVSLSDPIDLSLTDADAAFGKRAVLLRSEWHLCDSWRGASVSGRICVRQQQKSYYDLRIKHGSSDRLMKSFTHQAHVQLYYTCWFEVLSDPSADQDVLPAQSTHFYERLLFFVKGHIKCLM